MPLSCLTVFIIEAFFLQCVGPFVPMDPFNINFIENQFHLKNAIFIFKRERIIITHEDTFLF